MRFLINLVIPILISLQGFYLESLGFSPPVIFGAILLFCSSILVVLMGRKFISNNWVVLIFYLFSLFVSILALLFNQEFYDENRALGFLLVIVVAVSMVFLQKYLDIKLIVISLVFFHSIFFYFQFSAYYVFGIDVDYAHSFTGIAQKGWGGSYYHEELGKLRRLGGLYNEPGTYSTFIAPLVALAACYIKESLWSKSVFYFGLASLILSFSTFGLIFSAIIIGLVLYSYKGKDVLYLGAVSLLGVVFAGPYFYYRFFERASYGVETGLEFRFYFVEQVYMYLTSGVKEFIFGAGLLLPDLSGKVAVIAAVNDSSLILYLMLTIGPIATLCLLGFLLYKSIKVGRFSVAAITIVLISKASLFWLYTPFLLSLILFAQVGANSRTKNWFLNNKIVSGAHGEAL